MSKSSVKINCELPLGLLPINIWLNDYDFVLFHLYINSDEYKEYYKTIRKTNPQRTMILDNSAYEFYVKGETLDVDKYVQTINELKPDYYILPDVLMDQQLTLSGVEDFIENHSINCDAKPLAVVQGSTEEEMLECMNVYKQTGLNDICIPFHNSFYKDMSLDPELVSTFGKAYKLNPVNSLTEDMKYAAGRVQFIMNNYVKLEDFNYIHLLGSHCPFEKFFYRDSVISSMDTGYPVKLAMKRIRLGKEKEKPDIIIDDFFEKKMQLVDHMFIDANIRIFKNY